MKAEENQHNKVVVEIIQGVLGVVSLWVVFVCFATLFILFGGISMDSDQSQDNKTASKPISSLPSVEDNTVYWKAPDLTELDSNSRKNSILYGKELITNTALYFGPKGKVNPGSTNGMNCQNCHLEAGTKIFGNNYGSVASIYPKYRSRSGKVENVFKRVNDCFERSLNGKTLDTNSKEMTAISDYINWLGKDVAKGKKAEGSGFKELAFLDRAADPNLGKVLYNNKCMVCHNHNGSGQLNPNNGTFIYPPLWGNQSYNDGAGLYRISNFAKYIKTNMPLGATHIATQLTDEESWDIAAYVNSQERPKADISKDWPHLEEKPFDHPFGPFSDGFSENQHRFGPFKPIVEAKNKSEAKLKTLASK